jgi:hypothetical protein
MRNVIDRIRAGSRRRCAGTSARSSPTPRPPRPRPSRSRPARARKGSGWPKRCKLAHAFLWGYNYKVLKYVGPASGPTWPLSHSLTPRQGRHTNPLWHRAHGCAWNESAAALRPGEGGGWGVVGLRFSVRSLWVPPYKAAAAIRFERTPAAASWRLASRRCASTAQAST